MTGFGFPTLVCFSYMLFQCKGAIVAPAEGTNVTFLPGSTGNLTWKFDDDISALFTRAWHFTRRGGSKEELLATISDDDPRKIRTNKFSGVEIEKPATLLLENVNQSYNGQYRFSLTTKSSSVPETIDVNVFIAKRPTVTLNCSHTSPIVLNEGDNFICVCRGVDGNPPANVNWSKDSVEIREAKKEINTLTLRNVSGTANGTYKCEARSHTNDSYKDEKSVKLRVRPNSKPIIKSFTSIPDQPINGEKVTLTCESDGVPEPDYVIKFKNGSVASTEKTFEIPIMGSSYVGVYTCIAKNIKGNDSAVLNVTGQEQGTTTQPPTSNSSTKLPSTNSTPSENGNKGTVSSGDDDGDGGGGTNVGAIVGGVCGGLALLAIVAGLVYYFKKKEKDGRNCGNIDPAAGNHYELENECAGPADNAYDSVGPVAASSSKSKPPEKNTLPPVYAAVDKNNRQGNTLYASLDTDAMKPKRESKKEPERTPQTEYASIDFAKRADDNVPKADLV